MHAELVSSSGYRKTANDGVSPLPEPRLMALVLEILFFLGLRPSLGFLLSYSRETICIPFLGRIVGESLEHCPCRLAVGANPVQAQFGRDAEDRLVADNLAVGEVSHNTSDVFFSHVALTQCIGHGICLDWALGDEHDA